MKSITRTLIGSKLQTALMLGLTHTYDQHTTLNELFEIQDGVLPSASVNPKMGYLAVELLLQGKTNRIVCTHDGGFTDGDIDEGLSMQKNIQKLCKKCWRQVMTLACILMHMLIC